MQFQRFEDIKAWQESRILVSLVFRYFGDLRDFDFRRQLFRATLSAMNNIAEGYDAWSNPEFIRFLGYSQRSCTEVQSQLYVALDQDYISEAEFKRVYLAAENTKGKVGGFIKYLKQYNK